MTARARKKPALLVMPPLTCQVVTCAAEYPCIGDYADTDRAALLGGWIYRAGGWLCDAHRDHIPWWPGRTLLALPARVPGATRAEFLGVVPRAELAAAENVSRPGMGAQGEPATGLQAPRANTTPGHTEPHIGGTFREGLSGHPLLQEPAGGASLLDALPVPPSADGRPRPEERQAGPSDDLEPLPPEPRPGGTIYPQLTPQALAEGEPLESLAAEPEENEAEA